jgi:hypothetical protein
LNPSYYYSIIHNTIMAETDSSPPVTATSATSVKRERGSSPERSSDSSSTKRAKAENGDAVPVAEVKEEQEQGQGQGKEEPGSDPASTTVAPSEKGNGHSAQKMNDDKMEG